MPRAMKEWEQPTPGQVAKDALRNIPPHELTRAVPAQTPEEDALEDMYFPEDLAEITRDVSFGITEMLRIKPREDIKDSYEPTPGQFVRHSPLPEGNHYWRVASKTKGVFEVRTGPFRDGAVGITYQPELKVTKINNGAPEIIPSGKKAFETGLGIMIDVIPQRAISQT